MSEQVVDIFSLVSECSICLENIIGISNKVVTECGHTFHCNCLMKNITFNGFGCPYCRNVMAEYDGNYSDSDDDDDNDDDDDDDDNDDDDNDDDDEYDEDEDDDDDDKKMPQANYVTLKLKEKGFTMEDLVKIHLFLEHGEWGTYYREYEEMSGMIFREVGEILEQYKEAPVSADTDNEQNIPDDPNRDDVVIVSNNVDTVYDILHTNIDEIVYDTLDTIIDVIVNNN
jgi:hypothetical protein